MSEHQQRVFEAVVRLSRSLASPDDLRAYAGQIGRDHRKFGVKEKHYEAFFGALLETVRYFSGPDWTPRTQAAVAAALEHTATAMREAAAQDAQRQPAWWVGEVVGHELRTPSLAVLRIRPGQPLRYRAGQYISVQVARWPRVWRDYSLACPPRPDGLLELHVRAVRGGIVSNCLVHRCQPGDTLLLGPARGEMTAPASPARDLVCLAGGSGLAPVKAIIQDTIAAAAGAARRPAITLFFGARRASELYDLPALRAMAAAYPRLTVIPVVSAEPGYPGVTGPLPALVRQLPRLAGSEIYLCGPDPMVREASLLLARRGAAGLVHHDPPRGGISLRG
ncbi:MAG TPA: FAD-binding oxidoreductase [Streptosporangiaceae bacterium]